jgi:hypothetical protein
MTVEGELWKRAFWSVVSFPHSSFYTRVLVSVGGTVSAILGRSCAVHGEE